MTHRYRLTVFVLLILFTSSCRRTDKIKLEPTDESSPLLATTVFAADPKSAIQLTRGFHDVESNSWRWTQGHFAATVRPPAGAAGKGATLNLRFSLPESVLARVKETTISVSVDNTEVTKQTFRIPGEHVLTAEVPAALLKNDAVLLGFALDRYLAAGTVDERELGVVFLSCGLESK